MIALFKRAPAVTPPDPEALLRDLARALDIERYGETDRRRDFRRLFGGQDGRRVLYQILLWGGLYDAEAPLDSQELQRWAGRRDLATNILTALHAVLPENEDDD